MGRNLIFLLVTAIVISVGAGCRGCTPPPGGPGGSDAGDAGDGGGNPDPSGGDGGGGADGGGQDGGGADGGGTDAGNPYQTGGVPPGGFGQGGGSDGGSGWTGTGVQVSPDGGIILNSNDVQLHYAWIANNSNGWVSKYDTVTGREVARYYSVLPVSGLRPGGANSPSRTSLDLNGDVWVANRAPNIQGSVTKIINDTTTCPDRNGNGVIDTSRDINDSGVIGDYPGELIQPANQADINQYDECVVLTTPVGNNGSGVHARGMAVAYRESSFGGDVWVGLYAEKRLMRLDSQTGQPLPANVDGGMWLDLPFGPYGLAVDGRQRLWVGAAPGDYSAATLALVDTITRTVVDAPITAPFSSSQYGIAIDGKNRVWLGAWTGGAYAYRYDRPDNSDAGTWSRFYVGNVPSQLSPPTYMGRTRGITADDNGIVWVDAYTNSGGSGASQLIAIYGDDGGVRPFATDAGVQVQMMDFTDYTALSPPNATNTAIGVGVDGDGNIWVNNYSGNVVKVKYDTGDFVRLPNQGGSLYTYSDFTGYLLRHFTAPQGTVRFLLTGCGTNTVWDQVYWDAVTPPNTSIQLYVKAANSVSDLYLPSQVQYGPYPASPAQLQDGGLSPVAPSQYLLLQFVLTSGDHVTTPELRGFNGVWHCPVIFN